MATRIYVGGLPYATTDQQLRELFSGYGNVVSAQVIVDKMTGRSKGFAFVEMADATEAENAIHALHGSNLEGRSITVNEAKPRQDTPRFADEGRSAGRGDQRRSGGRGRR